MESPGQGEICLIFTLAMMLATVNEAATLLGVNAHTVRDHCPLIRIGSVLRVPFPLPAPDGIDFREHCRTQLGLMETLVEMRRASGGLEYAGRAGQQQYAVDQAAISQVRRSL